MGRAGDQDTDHPFRCSECGHRLFWDDLDYDALLVCGNDHCPKAAMPVPVWPAQEHRVARGHDAPPPDPGLPRPIMRGLPVPYITPVSNGNPWWALTHGARLLECRNGWRCQTCGLRLPERAWVVLSGRHVVSDSALHRECLRLALAHCPHLTGDDHLRYAEVDRADLGESGNQPVTTPAIWREAWFVRPDIPTHDQPPVQVGSPTEPTPTRDL